MAAALCLSASVQDYHLPEHPLQKTVKRTVGEVCGLAAADVLWAIDGCNLPTPAFALDRLALLYVKMASAADMHEASKTSGEPLGSRASALAKIYHAMTRHPELVAGEGRYCTVLMHAFGDALVGKLGADASYAIGVRACAATKALGTDGALGIAVKIEDGNVPMLYAVVSEVLALLQIGSTAQRQSLAAFHHPLMRNTMQVEAGRVEFSIALNRY
jgi:L-asparaginase II